MKANMGGKGTDLKHFEATYMKIDKIIILENDSLRILNSLFSN